MISQDNSSLMTMDTGQLLDLFTVDKEKKKEKPSAKQNETGKASLKTMIGNLGELWDEEQYETEYSLDNFIESLKWLKSPLCDVRRYVVLISSSLGWACEETQARLQRLSWTTECGVHSLTPITFWMRYNLDHKALDSAMSLTK